MICRLTNPIRNYAWGSREDIARFLGRPHAAAQPEAEMWIGAHPDGSSTAQLETEQVPLLNLIARAPESYLGAKVTAQFGGSLPYLMKVLAASAPLSLQAHPTLEQAIAGFEREEQLGIPRNAPNRNYRDRNHKPELLFATTPFEALCGFRAPEDIVQCLVQLDRPKLLELAEFLRAEPNASGLSKLVGYLLLAKPGQHRDLIAQTLDAAQAGEHSAGPYQNHLRWISELGRVYPGDVGVVTALLLNYVALAPGQAIFLPARSLHSYLSGVAIEIMASSDNVLRGGLTPKHMDAPELMRVLSFDWMPPPIVKPTQLTPEEEAFVTPAADFRLSRVTIAGRTAFKQFGPELLLCSAGSVTLKTSGDAPLSIEHGESVFVSAENGELVLDGQGELFRATVGDLASAAKAA